LEEIQNLISVLTIQKPGIHIFFQGITKRGRNKQSKNIVTNDFHYVRASEKFLKVVTGESSTAVFEKVEKSEM